MLADIGGDTAGAVSFGSTSDIEQWSYVPLTEFYKTPDPKDALERHFDDLSERPFLAGEDGVRLSLAGGQKKTALALLDRYGRPVLRLPQEGDQIAIPMNGAPSTIILKPDNARLPGIIENEVYCLRLAASIGIRAAETTIVKTRQRTAICSLRYDRAVKNDRILRVHQEDFAQANGVLPAQKYEKGTLPGVTMKALLRTGQHLSGADKIALLDQIIFNILVANTDAHAKNYFTIHSLGAKPALAPIYDVSTVLAWPHGIQFHAQKLAGRKRKPGEMAGRHWDVIAKEGGYRAPNLRKRVQELIDAIVAKRVQVETKVSALPGATPGYVQQAAEHIVKDALRIGGRLSEIVPAAVD